MLTVGALFASPMSPACTPCAPENRLLPCVAVSSGGVSALVPVMCVRRWYGGRGWSLLRNGHRVLLRLLELGLVLLDRDGRSEILTLLLLLLWLMLLGEASLGWRTIR